MNSGARERNRGAGTPIADFLARRVPAWGKIGRGSGKSVARGTAFRKLVILAAVLALLPATAMAQGWSYLYNSGSDMGVWS